MRHGEVSYFDEQGQPFRPDLVPLNPDGRRQAETMARELTRFSWDRVIASDLPRCQETARLVAPRDGVTLESREDLREIRPGRLSDIPSEAVRNVFLQAFGTRISRETRFLGGESFGSLLDRIRAFVQGLLADSGWRQVLIVAHGGVNRVFLTQALGMGLEGFSALEQDACCLNILDVDDEGRWLVRLMNHTPYNATKDGLELTTMERLLVEYTGRRATRP